MAAFRPPSPELPDDVTVFCGDHQVDCDFIGLTERLIASLTISGSGPERVVALLTAQGMADEQAIAALVGSTAATFAPSDEGTQQFLGGWATYIDHCIKTGYLGNPERQSRDDNNGAEPTAAHLRGLQLGIKSALSKEVRYQEARSSE